MVNATQRHIDWDSAEVHDRCLTVSLEGGKTEEWKRHFKAVVAQLRGGHGAWGAVKLKRGAIRVDAIEEGAEGDLRHFLESVVLQVNVDLPPAEVSGQDGGDDGRADLDTRMTRAFRDAGNGAG